MIKQAVGMLTTVAVLVVVVLTLLHHDRYSTLLRFGAPAEQISPIRDTLPAPVPTLSGADSVAVDSRSAVPGLPDSMEE